MHSLLKTFLCNVCTYERGQIKWGFTLFKSAEMLFFKYCTKRYGLGLSKELLEISIALGASKL